MRVRTRVQEDESDHERSTERKAANDGCFDSRSATRVRVPSIRPIRKDHYLVIIITAKMDASGFVM